MEETFAQHSLPVLACLDGGDGGDRALRYSLQEAERRGTGVRLFHVLEPPAFAVGPTGMFELPSAHDIGAHILKDGLERTFELAPDLYVEGALEVGWRPSSIAEESYAAACVVLGTRSFGSLHVLAGTTSTGTAARSACPVIAVPPSWDETGGRKRERGLVAVGVDETAGPAHVLEAAFAEATRRRATLVVVHAWQAPQSYAYAGTWIDPVKWGAAVTAHIADIVAPVADRHPSVEVEYLVRFENPRVTLDAVSARADVLVLGRHRGGMPLVHHLGSLPRHAIHQGTCPVMVVPMPPRD